MSRANRISSPTSQSRLLLAGAAAAALLLAGCDEGGGFSLPKPGGAAAETAASGGGNTVERDIEAPEVFSATDEGLWDGRPSLGGVWVAHPDVEEPERVIIRNTSNEKFVVGALFRKERDIPGPKLQLSSDAATALGILAGAPAPLNVTALRREEVAEETPPVADTAVTDDVMVASPADVTEASLEPAAPAAAVIDTAAATPPPVPAPTPKPAAPAPKPTSSLEKPFIQIGIFSVEQNADRVAKQMRGAGLLPTVKQQEANGKPFWRVLVGPATSSSERGTLLKTIKAEGFSDAYAVTN